jgi:hypothetical protein
VPAPTSITHPGWRAALGPCPGLGGATTLLPSANSEASRPATASTTARVVASMIAS